MTTPPVCDYEGSDYQSTFWDQGGRAYEDGAEEVALKRLLPEHGKLMLEIGAGAGRNTPRYRGYDRIVLLDYSRTQLQQAKARLGDSARYIFVAADAYKLPFINGLFDGATMIRTLHHMADAPVVLGGIRQVLKPGAIFILEFANKLNFKAILRYLLRQQDWNPFTLEPVEFVKLNFDFHPDAIRQWLTASGFAIERMLTVSHYRSALLKRIIPAKILIWLDAWAQPTGNWWQLTPSVFVRAKAEGSSTLTAHPEKITDYFRCPECGHTPLFAHDDHLECNHCKRKYMIKDGIYDFRGDE
jgi:ubiquinone/menaquinone biosynthesis C-methylase UbiE